MRKYLELYAAPLLPVLLFALLTMAGGCARAWPDVKLSASDAELAADLVEIPQDPFMFAQAGGEEDATAPLLPRQRREEMAARAVRTFFRPWELRRASTTPLDALWGYYALKPERGFMENLRPYSQERWEALARNADIPNYPSLALPAITVDRADLRLMPTHSPYFFEPARPGQGYPFDYYQNSSLPLGTPVLITHVSLDGAWALVESSSAGGWVDRAHLALVDSAFIVNWKSRPLAAVLRERVPFRPPASAAGPRHGTAAGTLQDAPRFADIGALLPLGLTAPEKNKTAIYYPVKNEHGYARMEKARLPKEDAVPWPFLLNKKNMALLISRMLGQPYGWGGYGGNRDCSSTLRDLYLAFGVWLPRNSKGQAELGLGLNLAELPPAEKESLILREGRPFLSLISQPGHIMLYLGEYKGRAVVFHNLWGLRTKRPGAPSPGRAIIGKAVLTSLAPGRERGDLAHPDSLLGGINRLSFPLGK